MHTPKFVAVVGIGAVLPDASDAASFWQNILASKNSIADVPPDRWDTGLYYDPDPSVPDKTYSKIGAFVRGYQFDPLKNGIAIPPKVLAVMDVSQQWAIAASQQALKDYGYPGRKLEPERVAVIFGNALAGEAHYRSTFRLLMPEYQQALASIPDFQNLPQAVQAAILKGVSAKIKAQIAPITEDTMPGELGNIIAGRVANLFNFSGPNYITDAACASSLAALQGAVDGLMDGKFDAVLTGGIDRNMGPESYIKFSKIGALSADGSRPYADGANGFVMGEGAVVFLLKRLEDAEREGDRIYAVIRGVGGSSDGKGKGITAPNPLGQQRALERAWRDAGVNPEAVGMIEGHGTSTKVGDVAEVGSLNAIFGALGLKTGSVVLGSVKSNIGHLKSAAGAVGLLKTVLALHHHVLPPTVNFARPNPNIDFANLPFRVISQPQEWEARSGNFRFAGVSSFGFGGTNFHVVLEEYFPGVAGGQAPTFAIPERLEMVTDAGHTDNASAQVEQPLNVSADFEKIKTYVLQTVSEKTGYPVEMLDLDLDLEADLGIDTVKQAELFATVRTHFGIPRREDLRLSDYTTLTKVIGFVQDALNTGQAAAQTAAGSDSPPETAAQKVDSGASEPSTPVVVQMQASSADLDAIKAHVLGVVSEKTGYPVEMFDLDLDLEADLGIDTVKQAELFATVRTYYGIPRREDLRLSEYSTLSKVIGFVQDALNAGAGQAAAPAPDVTSTTRETNPQVESMRQPDGALKPFQGLFFASAQDNVGLLALVQQQLEASRAGQPHVSVCPTADELARSERICIDYADAGELLKRLEKAATALAGDNPAAWKALQAHGIFRGSSKAGKVAFLFPGQGSQYVNMLLDLMESEPVVRATFEEADRVMTPILGRSLTSFIFTSGSEEELKQAEQELKNTAITQPAMLTADVAVLRLLNKFGLQPDMVIGHSLGEYAALVAAGVLTFAEALEVVSARGREMTKIKVDDPGCMAAVSAPLEKVEEVIRALDGYVVIANINSPVQCVLGGSTAAVEAAIAQFTAGGFQAVKIPVSHAFHTKIVAPASVPLREVIARMDVQSPRLQIVANVTGELYPTGREEILDILASQVASPVQFVKSMQTLYDLGARIFIESGPKRVLNALATDNLKERQDVTIIATNHPRKGGIASFNEALCGMYAAGIPAARTQPERVAVEEAGQRVLSPARGAQRTEPANEAITGSVVISGVGLGLPGRDRHVFADDNIERILDGEMMIEPLSNDARSAMLDKHVTRLVKSDAGAVMESVNDLEQVLKLSGQGGEFDLTGEFGVPQERVESLDVSTQLAIAAGIEALRDAGIPLVMAYRRTTRGTFLPDRWKLPAALQDETGVIFGSAFPGMNRMVEESDRFYESKMLERQLDEVQQTIDVVNALHPTGATQLLNDLQRRKFELARRIQEADYHFDRRFIFRVLSMGHSQFAEYIGARGPNTHVNAACATTTHAISVAEDWIRAGRCRRVIVIAGDDVTNENMLAWIGTSLFASGAATTEGDVRLAAMPFDRRRNGMIMGMGAAALVVESQDAANERGVRAIGEILSTHTANSAFHGTRLDVQHVSEVMEQLLRTAEQRFGIDRHAIAAETVFMSHETYTPARGGSASAEIRALRQCFGAAANQVIIANTKGFTGHSMGVGIEDVVATKALETGKVPPIAHIGNGFEADPELGDLNLSRGGFYHPRYALRLGAGFGSQIAMSLVQRIPGEGERIDAQRHGQWLAAVSGYSSAELEVSQRTLRIKDQGVPQREPVKSSWQYGQLPSAWAEGEQRLTLSAGISLRSETTIQPETVAVEMVEQPVETPATQVNAVSAEDEAIKAHVLGVVSEKTGYPVEMLDLDLDLEADLGIDTVKQAELFAAIRTHYGIPRREDLRLSDYNTLTRVIGFVQDALSANAGQTAAESVPVEQAQPDADTEIETQPGVTRRVPVPALFPRSELCLPSGVSLDGATVVVIGDAGKVGAALAKKLKAAGANVHLASPSDAAARVEELAQMGSLAGVYDLQALDADPDWHVSGLEAWSAAWVARAETLYQVGRVLPKNAFLLTGTRMGGLHGLHHPENPLGGLSSGFIKALRREHAGMLAKVVDFQGSASASAIAAALLDETRRDPVTAEVGYNDGLRFGVALREEDENHQPNPLKPGSVFVVSGGTGGITAPVVIDLAKATSGSFYLLGRAQLPARDDADLQKLRADRNAFRVDLGQRMKATHEKVTPVMVEQKVAALERAAATLDAIAAVEKAGGKAVYITCDVTDAQSAAGAMAQVRQAETQVDVFIHAAGMDHSRKLESKPLDEFQQVLAVKANGFANLFAALEQNGLRPGAVVFFSSVAGRFGNSGQTDYSAANDLLSKHAAWLPQQFPGLQAISIDWGAWAEVGMASRGHIPELMARAGIDMLKPAAAAALVRAELERGASGEVVIAGSLGLLEQADGANCGLDIARADAALREGNPIHIMYSHLTGFDASAGIRLEAELDPEQSAFLRDHAINGVPVLPGVVGIEGFSVAARHIASVLASDKDGFEVERLENIRFLAPVKFYGSKPRSITWNAVAYRLPEGLKVEVRLESDTKRINGETDHMLHFTGTVFLVASQPAARAQAVPPKWSKKLSVSAEEIYRLYFHGPSFQVLESAQASGDKVLGRFNKKLANGAADQPGLMATPLLIELCFQTAGLFEVGATGTMALPESIGSLVVYPQPLNGVPIYAEVQPRMQDGRYLFDARVVDGRGNVFLELCDYQTSPLPYPAEQALVEPLRVLVNGSQKADVG